MRFVSSVVLQTPITGYNGLVAQLIIGILEPRIFISAAGHVGLERGGPEHDGPTAQPIVGVSERNTSVSVAELTDSSAESIGSEHDPREATVQISVGISERSTSVSVAKPTGSIAEHIGSEHDDPGQATV